MLLANEIKISSLENFANRIRISALCAIHTAKSGHPGGALSCAELLAYLWQKELKADAKEAEHRNRFILSKGHACPALYAAATITGLISKEVLLTFRKLGSPLQGHPHVLDLPWVETSTGSLGQGFSVAIGMALGFRYQKKTSRVYVMLGDGELQEGEVWEGAMSASHYKLDNLCAILDYNKMQSDDLNENIMTLEPLAAKWAAFNWHVIEIDGHNFEEIDFAFKQAKGIKDKPTIIIAHTIKGKGVSFMESSPLWHGSVMLRDEELTQALEDLQISENDIPRYIDGSIWQDN